MFKMRVIITVLFFIVSHYSIAGLESYHYYPLELTEQTNKIDYKNEELKELLFKVLSYKHIKQETGPDLISKTCPENKKCYEQMRNLSYKQARKHLFGSLHLEEVSGRSVVKDVYCNIDFGSEIGVGEDKIPNHRHLNCEHTWPQSRFNRKFSKRMQKSDLHHLYPVYSPANSTRSNNRFGMVDGVEVSGRCTDSQKGKIVGTSLSGFQPPQEHRGNVARALFYFSIHYKLPISEHEEKFLRLWHEQDPVDEFEAKRNNAIFQIQKSRNPFIDDPTLVNRIDDF